MDQQAKFFNEAAASTPATSAKSHGPKFWLLATLCAISFVGLIFGAMGFFFFVSTPPIIAKSDDRVNIGSRSIVLNYCMRSDFNNQGVEEICISTQIANFGDGSMEMPGLAATLIDAEGNRYAPDCEPATKHVNPNLSVPVVWNFRVPKSVQYERIEFYNPRTSRKASIRMPVFSTGAAYFHPNLKTKAAPPPQD